MRHRLISESKVEITGDEIAYKGKHEDSGKARDKREIPYQDDIPYAASHA